MAQQGFRPPAITREIEKIARTRGWKDAPSERTVRRLYQDFKELPDEVRREQATFHWPDAMEIGALPWEASRAALDLARFRDERGAEPPTIQQVKWFWRLLLAAPTIDLPRADWLAGHLATREYFEAAGFSPPVEIVGLEAQLTFEPWREENRGAYERIAARDGLPGWDTLRANVNWSNVPAAEAAIRMLYQSLRRELVASDTARLMREHVERNEQNEEDATND